MSPDVLARKLERLRRYLDDLAVHRGRTADEVAADPYAVERLLELVVQVSVDILSHQLAERGLSPESYRHTFELAGGEGLFAEELLLSWITWVLPDRALGREMSRVLEVGYVRGADLWHLACALYLVEDPPEISFVTLDDAQGVVAAGLGFAT